VVIRRVAVRRWDRRSHVRTPTGRHRTSIGPSTTPRSTGGLDPARFPIVSECIKPVPADDGTTPRGPPKPPGRPQLPGIRAGAVVPGHRSARDAGGLSARGQARLGVALGAPAV
jgi:hypothetical protein